jgi:hypothetical protein
MPERSIRRRSFRNSTWRRGERRFRLVEDEQALALAALLEEAQKALAMRMGEKIRRRAAEGFARGLVEIARDREETFRPEEPTLCDLRQPACAQRLRELLAHRLEGAGVIDRPVALAAACLVIAGEHGHPFEQRRFAGAVLPDNDRDRAIELKLEFLGEKRQAERIGRRIADPRPVEPDLSQVRRREIDRAGSFAGQKTLST